MLGGRCNRSAGVDSIRSGVEDIEGAIELTPLSI
jgi:hypothetical protein